MEKKTTGELLRPDIEAFKSSEKIPVSLVLDNVRSAYNVGSVFRTSDAFKVEKLYLCGITAGGDNREVLKTSLGATESVEWAQISDIIGLLRQLKEQHYTIWAIEQVHGSISLRDTHTVPKPLALIFGNEVSGVDNEVLKLCDACIEIPQFGTKHSLNVSVSAGIVLWHLGLVAEGDT